MSSALQLDSHSQNKTSMGSRECAKCHISKPRDAYSTNQLKKTIGTSTCTDCINNWAEDAPVSNATMASQNAMFLAQLMQQVETLDPAEAALARRPVSQQPQQSWLLQPELAERPAKRLCTTSPQMYVPSLEDLSLPRVVVFDLDETCWKHGLDRKGAKGSPYSWCPSRRCIVDAGGVSLTVFPDLVPILMSLSQACVPIGIASHNSKPAWCFEVMDKFYLDSTSDHTWGDLVPEKLRVINCESTHWPLKAQHLKEIAANAGCTLKEMVYFDDGKKICHDAEAIGVTAVRTPDGITLPLFMEAMNRFSSRALIQQKRDQQLQKLQSSLHGVPQAKPTVSPGTML